jgi:hypothetical protein
MPMPGRPFQVQHIPTAARNPAAAPRCPAYRRGMDISDIRWNDQARQKILDDADRVLQEAVVDIARNSEGISADDAFAELNRRLKDRFIDWEPGPDLRTYADAIAAGEISTD